MELGKNILRNYIRHIINENFEFDESFSFDWKNGTYKWVDDKEGKNIDTTMAKRDESGVVQYNFQKKLLPKSEIMSYNLFKIKNFNVTQSLKHGKVTRTNSKDKSKSTYELTPDKSISEFKKHTAKYISRLLSKLGYNIDVVLTPQSSSGFNGEIADLIAEIYDKLYNKKIHVYKNAFQKSPENITIDKNNIKKNLRPEIEKYAPANTPEKQINKYIKDAIEKLKHDISIWKIESDMYPTIKNIYKLYDDLHTIENSRKWQRTKEIEMKEIILEIDRLLNYIKTNFGEDYISTRFFKYGKLKNEKDVKPWQIKNLSDAVRRSINNVFIISKDLDKEYTYKTKEGELLAGRTSFIENLKRNNKTILIFDDNVSSGATLDDICMHLINSGVNKDNIAVVTLGTVPASLYNRNTSRLYK